MSFIQDLEAALHKFSGDPFDVIHSLRPLPPDRWDPVSIDGKHLGTVTKHDVGAVLPNEAWASWAWTGSGGGTDGDLKVVAAQGSKDVDVQIAGASVDTKGRIQVRPIVVGLSLKISVRVHFVKGGAATEYRFDGHIAP